MEVLGLDSNYMKCANFMSFYTRTYGFRKFWTNDPAPHELTRKYHKPLAPNGSPIPSRINNSKRLLTSACLGNYEQQETFPVFGGTRAIL